MAKSDTLNANLTKRLTFLSAAALALLIVLLIVPLVACSETEPDTVREHDPVTVAASTYIGSAPVFVAHHNGYFREQGLDVSLTINQAGIDSLRNLFRGEADIAMVAELPLVYSAFDRSRYTGEDPGDFVAFADMFISTNISRVLVRADRGITTPDDLRSRTVGVPMDTSIDFLLDLFLLTQGIDRTDLTLVDLDADELVDAIARGDVDAIFLWQPHVGIAQDRLGDSGRMLDLDLFYHNAWLTVTMKSYLRSDPTIPERFLRALVRAEEFMSEAPDRSIEIHADYTGTPAETVQRAWDDVTFWISLSESLLTTMDDEARWVIRNEWTDRTRIPNFLEYIDTQPLEQVKPEGISIIQ